MEQSKYLYMYREVPLAASNMKAVENTDLILKTSVGTKDSPGPHRHRYAYNCAYINLALIWPSHLARSGLQ